MIYFDNAATSGKKPDSVINAVNYALKNLSANPGRSGHDLSLKTADAIYGVRSKIAKFFGADGPENVVFTQNCTHAINCVIKGGVTIGEHIVVSNFEHNSVMRPLKKSKISCTVAKVEENLENTVENFKNAIKPNTKLVFVSGASNVTGKILPFREIGEICKKRGILFGVDGAQIAGVLPVNMQRDNIDFLCIAPHKGLYAPMGIGILICRKPLKNTIIEGGTGTDSYDFLQPLDIPEGFESGTVNVPAIMGVGAGIDFVEKLTLEKIYKHEFSLLEMLYKRLLQMDNILLYTKPPIFNENVAVLPFNLKGIDSYHLAEFLNSNGVAVRSGLHCAPTAHQAVNTDKNGACRVSFGVFNNKQEIERFCAILSDKKINKLQKSY
ncbi:MAG: aminotransferase class V-fold PLP-dependent enzyme [Clostridia bacterium]|nr:aminotransferase class V-fold PLP-dependent enzyme [Clostridia bacterium]